MVKDPNVWEFKTFACLLVVRQAFHVRSKCTHTDRRIATDNLYISMIKIKAQLLVGSCKNITKLKLN